MPRSEQYGGTPGEALTTVPIRGTGRIVAVVDNGDGSLARRLNDLGFVPGATVEAVRRAPLGDPVVYRIADYEVCLRRAQAGAIRVDAVVATASV